MGDSTCLPRDISHPDAEHQKNQVLQTFAKLKVPLASRNNILTVANKIDKVPVRKLFCDVNINMTTVAEPGEFLVGSGSNSNSSVRFRLSAKQSNNASCKKSMQDKFGPSFRQ